MHGPGWALLGKAAEFLDPVFSSGVCIAMKSADLATGVLGRQLRAESVDWDREFSEPLKIGVEMFSGFVERWYDGRLRSEERRVGKECCRKCRLRGSRYHEKTKSARKTGMA